MTRNSRTLSVIREQLAWTSLGFLPFAVFFGTQSLGSRWHAILTWTSAAVCVCLIIPIAVVSLRRHHALYCMVRQRQGAVCLGCRYPLPHDEIGVCPECGRGFTKEENRKYWGIEE